MTILGPGGRGVVVATGDPKTAAFDRLTLRAAGIPAATVADLGLSLPSDAGSIEERTSHWAVATRRPVVLREDERLAVGRPDGSVAVTEPPTLSSDMVLGQSPPPRVAVFGGAWTGEDETDFTDAFTFGERMAGTGVQVICGGYGGVMEAVARGAKGAGGVAVGVGVTPWADRVTPNRWLTHRVDAETMLGRYPLILDAEAWVAFPGGVGTLAEVTLGWNLMQMSVEPRPLLVIGERWQRLLDALRRDLIVKDATDLDLVRTVSAREAAEAIEGLIGGRRA